MAARFVRIQDTTGTVRLVNADHVVTVEPWHPFQPDTPKCRLWFDQSQGDIWIDTRLPFDELAALLNGEG